jgi:hypothetical protein
VVFVPKHAKEFQHSPDIENFDALAFFHDLDHTVKNVQALPED